MRPLILASASPRRRELLAQITEDFEVVAGGVDEDALTTDDPWETAERLAEAKARAVLAQRPEALVIGGDTVVAIEAPPRHPAAEASEGEKRAREDDEEGAGGGDPPATYRQLAKPLDVPHAREMLRQLSDREHLVITGVCVASADGVQTFSDTTRVRFRRLNDVEITAYVATGEPMDKAGAYAIQGGAAGFVSSVDGSLTNVIGLPIERLRDALQQIM
jgi:septum formation protein